MTQRWRITPFYEQRHVATEEETVLDSRPVDGSHLQPGTTRVIKKTKLVAFRKWKRVEDGTFEWFPRGTDPNKENL